MAQAGKLFAENQLIVAEVLQCAEVMKAAVERLEPLMASEESAGRGVVALATVKGDVHDIGKNLVHIILKNNGYKVVDLGIKATSQQIIEGVRRSGAGILGLSGLLVRSCQEMATVAADLSEAGIAVPIIAGGAALSARFVAQKMAPRSSAPVFYAQDAMAGLTIVNEIFSQRREAFIRENASAQESLRRKAGPAPAPAAHSPEKMPGLILPACEIPQPPDLDLHSIELDDDEVFKAINPQMLYGKHLGLKGSIARLFEAGDRKAADLRHQIEDLRIQARGEGLLACRAVYRFLPCQRDEDRIVLYGDPNGNERIASISFPRQAEGSRLCLADLAAPRDSGRMDFLAAFVVSSGAGVREAAAKYREAGEYFKSHALSALALELAEAGAEVLHGRLRAIWGIGQKGARFSFGYPACPDLEPQAKLLEILDAKRTVGVTLSEGFMMDPEASVSALVFHAAPARVVTAP
jgi:5-methyltetrahydrofolate--homocysteine methyltransferase